MIAYCGIDCSTCEGYRATQSNDARQLAAVAERWSAQYHADIKPEHVICDGCKAEKRKSFHCANSCKINTCCIEKRLDCCIECADFSCSEVEFVLSNAPEAKVNLEKLKK